MANDKRQSGPTSPTWGSTTKLVVALTFVAVLAGLLIRFQNIIAPLLMAFVLAYLFHPVASALQRGARFSWRAAVGLIYLVILILVLGLLTLGGVGLVQQGQSLVGIVQESLTKLPVLLEQVSGRAFQWGPFSLDLTRLDLSQLGSQVLGMIQPLLGRTGSLLGSFASGAASFAGWTLFVLLVSYFILSESDGLRGNIISVEIPGYSEDVGRLSRELGRIWNAFLRGQIIIFLLTVSVYSLVLTILGVRYALGLALLAGLARFLPYVGPSINWVVLALVAYFQEFKLFEWPPLTYMLVVLGCALLIDQIFDNLVSPRILSHALRVHPAGVLVAAIISANLLGLLGIIIAAPMLATVMLMWRYTMHKMLDLDPWPENEAPPPPPPASRLLVRLRRLWRARGQHPEPPG
jgi:predicted PurR-regulated permease PerM